MQNRVMIYGNPDEIIEEIFDSLLSRYQVVLETQMRLINFIFDCVNLLHYKCYKINLKRGISYIDSLHWIKKSNDKPKIC